MGANNARRRATVLIIFGLFILWGFGLNTVGRRLLMSTDGFVVASRAVQSGMEYKIRHDDGSEQILQAGGTDASLPRDMLVGTRIRKQPWHLDYERDGRRVSFPWIFYSLVLGIGLSLVVWGVLILRSLPPNPLHRNYRMWLSGSLRGLLSARRLLSILFEGVGIILFASGSLSTILFLSTKSRVELVARGAKIPEECQAAFWNHGGYACWYTIQDHPFWFILSLGAVASGIGIITWSQNHWFTKSKNVT